MVSGEREGIIRPLQAESGADNHACGSEDGVQCVMLAEGPAGDPCHVPVRLLHPRVFPSPAGGGMNVEGLEVMDTQSSAGISIRG